MITKILPTDLEVANKAQLAYNCLRGSWGDTKAESNTIIYSGLIYNTYVYSGKELTNIAKTKAMATVVYTDGSTAIIVLAENETKTLEKEIALAHITGQF